MAEAIDRLVTFAHCLRAEGVKVGTSKVLDFCSALALLGPAELYWAGRICLVTRQPDLEIYDQVFRSFFRDAATELPSPAPEVAGDGAEPQGRERRALATQRHLAAQPALASPNDSERTRSFADWSPEELDRLAELLRRRPPQLPQRRTRRLTASRAGRLDLRRTLRRSFRTGGETVQLSLRDRKSTPRRLILLLDVSRSMSPYSRALLLFGHVAVRRNRGGEAFCFGTRLTHVTRAVGQRRPEEILTRTASEVADWEGGTRIGGALKTFVDEYGHRGLARGAVVVIASDGLDAGPPELLGQQMARLSRLAHRIVWLNPLAASPRYEPLARGMHAALPHVDVFLSGHDLASFEAMEEQLLSSRGRRP